MHILWVKVGGLWPLNTGGRRRSFHIVAELARRHRVRLVTTHGPGDDPRGLAAHLPDCVEVVSVPFAPAKHGGARFIRALLASWASPLPVDLWKCRVPALRDEVIPRLRGTSLDFCVADFLAAVPNVPIDGTVPLVLFAHNVEHVIWQRLAQVERRRVRRALIALEGRKMRRYEARACDRAGITLTVSDTDRTTLAALAPGASIAAIPTGVDTAYFAPNGARETSGALVFTGSMDWYPNEDAIRHFMAVTLPRIRAVVPNVSLTVVGRNPRPGLRDAAAKAGVRVTGTVDDVRPYVAEAAVYVVPLRVGGGTRLKIYEALAMGKAVVSTAIGAEGLPLVPGEHFLRADEPADFADAVVSLIQDPARRRSLGQAGRRLVEERYAWSRVAREFEARCEEGVIRRAS
jgi:sugar transferase (PEP-CTERM/EpsH1 system associated)